MAAAYDIMYQVNYYQQLKKLLRLV
jgi:hypothetical protein